MPFRSDATTFAPSGVVTLVTDFGTVDGYAGAMKGVVLAECAGARVVDITHQVPPQDVRAGARALEVAAPWFPPGTIHVAVVDPGVGTARRPLLVSALDQLFLGPDNGLLAVALDAVLPHTPAAVAVIDRLPPAWALSSTFHGRDLFARVAGRLCAGAQPTDFASSWPEAAAAPVRLARPAPERLDDGVGGEVVHVDRFGNLITNVGIELLRQAAEGGAGGEGLVGRVIVEIARRHLPLVATYGEAASGALLACVGSTGCLEVAVRDGSAADSLNVGPGERLRVRAR